jgi:hypothetical protein
VNRRNITLALCAAAVGLGGCSLFESKRKGPGEVDDFGKSIELVYVNAEVSKGTVLTAIDALQGITATDYVGDAVEAYSEFVVAIERSEQQAQKLRDAVEPMKGRSAAVFEQWNKNLEAFSSPEMRARSQARLAVTRERYEAIVAAVDPALEV